MESTTQTPAPTELIQLTVKPAPNHAEDIESMVSDLMSSSDIFRLGHSGTWALGIINGRELYRPELGWLVWNEGGDTNPQDENAIAAFKAGAQLPEGYYRIDRETATRIVHQGIYQHGIGFFDGEADANMVDNIIQEVLLGELTYC